MHIYIYVYTHLYMFLSMQHICSMSARARTGTLQHLRSAVFAAFPELHLPCFAMLAARQLYFETLPGPRTLQMLFCTPLQPNRSQPQTLKQQAYANKQRHPSLTIKVSRQVEWFNTSFSSSIRLHRHASPRWATEGSPTRARTHWSLLCRVVQTWDL